MSGINCSASIVGFGQGSVPLQNMGKFGGQCYIMSAKVWGGLRFFRLEFDLAFVLLS
jgi:hypothetical protein